MSGALSAEVQRFRDFSLTLQMQIRETQNADGNAAVPLDDWLLEITRHLLVLSEAVEHAVSA